MQQHICGCSLATMANVEGKNTLEQLRSHSCLPNICRLMDSQLLICRAPKLCIIPALLFFASSSSLDPLRIVDLGRDGTVNLRADLLPTDLPQHSPNSADAAPFIAKEWAAQSSCGPTPSKKPVLTESSCGMSSMILEMLGSPVPLLRTLPSNCTCTSPDRHYQLVIPGRTVALPSSDLLGRQYQYTR
jgi:hypothetical protein